MVQLPKQQFLNLLFGISISLLTQLSFSYDEPSSFNLKAPTGIERGSAELRFQHRFYGKVNEEPLSSLFGMYAGANVGIGLRYCPLTGLEFEGSYIRDEEDISISLSYSYFSPIIGLLLGTEFFNYKSFDPKKVVEQSHSNNIFIVLSAQTVPLYNKRIILTSNFGIDSEEKKLNAALGLNILIIKMNKTLQRILFIAEYFPTRSRETNERYYAIGVRLETYGHHFDFMISNGSDIGIRRMMRGSNKEDGIYLGFNIKRLIGD